jgi:hypothetical protein
MLDSVRRAKDYEARCRGQQGDGTAIGVLGHRPAHGRTQIGVPQHTGMRRGHLWRVGERATPRQRASRR